MGFCAIHLTHKQLLAVRKACEITQAEPEEAVTTQKKEDAIKIETLDELSRNANEEIRNAAIKIVIDRASKSKACHLMLRDISSKNRERRDKALTTVKYLHRSIEHCFDAYKYTAVQSVISCLSLQLPLSYKFEIGKVNGEIVQRTQPERDALELLEIFLMRYGVTLALECNIFSLWLAKYPFGGNFEVEFPEDKVAQLAAKQRLVHQMSIGKDLSDLAMVGIINVILASEEAIEKMFTYELMSRSIDDHKDANENEKEDEYSKIWCEVHGISTAPDVGLGPMMRRGVRARDESWEEQVLRRRRREAMVLGEMGRPIERENIIQRVNT
ncbi:MAG: hypothetical protein LQ343_003202 [Gyalolechia ehrenbergii]|nr:MAG: hypothetical protein LQ343_003202 [Gyalolechia ehrenbergii]